MNLTLEQQNELGSMMAQHGIDVVLRDLSSMMADGCGSIISHDSELVTAILCNAHDVQKAADSITYRAWTGRDLYKNEVFEQ